MGWIVVYIAPTRSVATMLRDLLQREGLMVTVRPIRGIRNAEEAGFEILVPSSEAKDASEVLARAMGG